MIKSDWQRRRRRHMKAKKKNQKNLFRSMAQNIYSFMHLNGSDYVVLLLTLFPLNLIHSVYELD